MIDVAEYLNRKGIKYKTVSSDNAKFPCPKCGDKNSFAISLKTGAYICHRANKCNIKGSFKDFQILMGDNIYAIPKKYKKPPERQSEKLDKALEFLKSRAIQPETARKFRIGYIKGSVMFQYHKAGKLVNIKYRKIDEKKFYQESGCMHTLWNQDAINGDVLVITEGEIDAMSLAEYGEQAVSIPSGVNDLAWIENDWEYLERFTQIYLCLDNDEAGQEAAEKIAKRLGYWRCYNVILPYKDANECLMNKVSKEKIIEAFLNANSYQLNELKSSESYTDKVTHYKNNPNELDGITTSKKGLNLIIHGWRNGELSVWTGKNSAGKSTILIQEMLHLISLDKKVCIGSFEMQPHKFLWWLLRQKTGGSWISDEGVEQILTELSSNLYIIDILGNIESKKLFEIMEYGWRRYGIDTFLIDSLMKIQLTTDNRKIYGEQKKFVSELKDFAQKSNSHIHLVAHPRKTQSDENLVGSTDVAGTGDITNLADNVFVVYRFTKKQKKAMIGKGEDEIDAKIHVLKNREHGATGQVNLIYNEKSKTFTEFTKEPVI